MSQLGAGHQIKFGKTFWSFAKILTLQNYPLYGNVPFFIPIVLDTNNAAYLILKHGFPPAKWQNLAIGLQQGGHTQSILADKHSSVSRLISVLKHWIANDDERTWRKLKEAMEMSEEYVAASELNKIIEDCERA